MDNMNAYTPSRGVVVVVVVIKVKETQAFCISKALANNVNDNMPDRFSIGANIG
jgi:hypothetical protein